MFKYDEIVFVVQSRLEQAVQTEHLLLDNVSCLYLLMN